MRPQAEKFGAEMTANDIMAVDPTNNFKLLTDSAGTLHRAKAVIIATGSGYCKLGFRNEERCPEVLQVDGAPTLDLTRDGSGLRLLLLALQIQRPQQRRQRPPPVH